MNIIKLLLIPLFAFECSAFKPDEQPEFYAIRSDEDALLFIDQAKQPEWSNELDFEKIELDLQQGNIVFLVDMKVWLEYKQWTSHYTNPVYIAVLDNGLLGVFKPEETLKDSIAEVAAYRASQFLELGLVPPTVYKEQNSLKGSLQFFVRTTFDLFNFVDERWAFGYVPRKELNDARIFRFIFGQWDIHNGNWMVGTRRDILGGQISSLALVDNGAMSNVQQAQYAEFAFVRHSVCPSAKGDGYFPFDTAQTIIPENLEQLRVVFGDTEIEESVLQNWINWGGRKTFIKWQGFLWIQYYKGHKTIRPNYTGQYWQSTLDVFSNLTEAQVRLFYSGCFGDELSSTVLDLLVAGIIDRRDQVLRASYSGTIEC